MEDRKLKNIYLMKQIKIIYWRMIDWISRRVFWLAVLPWTLPILGGLFISQHLPPHYSLKWILIGTAIVLFATIPLGLNALRDKRIQDNDDQIDAQERQCLSLAADLIRSIPIGDSNTLGLKEAALDEAIEKVVSSLVKRIYSNIPEVRAVVFSLGSNQTGLAFTPSFFAGRGPEPGTHLDGSERFEELMLLAKSYEETKTGLGVERKSYTSYVAASIARDETLYGILSLDTPEDWEFSDRDEKNFLILSRLLGAFFAAAQNIPVPVSSPSNIVTSVKLFIKARRQK